MRRQINQAGLDLIKSFEGLRLKAYKDSVGIPTIGYGHIRGVKMGQEITEAQAEEYLRADLEDAEKAVERLCSAKLTDNQFAALVSFVFNLGAGAFEGSTLRRKLNLGAYSEAAEQFAKWNKARVRGVLTALPGLTRRRAAERKLFEQA